MSESCSLSPDRPAQGPCARPMHEAHARGPCARPMHAAHARDPCTRPMHEAKKGSSRAPVDSERCNTRRRFFLGKATGLRWRPHGASASQHLSASCELASFAIQMRVCPDFLIVARGASLSAGERRLPPDSRQPIRETRHDVGLDVVNIGLTGLRRRGLRLICRGTISANSTAERLPASTGAEQCRTEIGAGEAQRT